MIVDDNVVDGDEVCQQVGEPGLMVNMGNTLTLIQEVFFVKVFGGCWLEWPETGARHISQPKAIGGDNVSHTYKKTWTGPQSRIHNQVPQFAQLKAKMMFRGNLALQSWKSRCDLTLLDCMRAYTHTAVSKRYLAQGYITPHTVVRMGNAGVLLTEMLAKDGGLLGQLMVWVHFLMSLRSIWCAVGAES
jgi:hypothetical protein